MVNCIQEARGGYAHLWCWWVECPCDLQEVREGKGSSGGDPLAHERGQQCPSARDERQQNLQRPGEVASVSTDRDYGVLA